MKKTISRSVPVFLGISFAQVGVAGMDGERVGAAAPEARSVSSAGTRQSAESGRGRSIEEIVVTAQKREERLLDVPISISVLSGDDLDRSTAQGVSEALSRVAGVTVDQPLAGGARIVVRGIYPVAGSNTTAYYLDGVPFGFVKSAFAPADANAFDLQRVEVLRGPQGTLYGANAFNGVMRILTREPDLDGGFELKVRTVASSTDESGENYRGDAAVNLPIVEGKLTARATVSYEDVGGWIDGPLGNDLNDGDRRSYRLKLGARPTEQLTIGLSAWSMRDDFGAPSISTDDRQNSAIIPERYSVDMDVYGLRIGYDFGRFSVTSQTSYFEYQNPNTLDLGIFGAPFSTCCRGSIFLNDFEAEVFSEELVLTSNSGSPWTWTAGAFYRDAEDRGFSSIPQFNSNIDDSSNSESYAFFGELGRRFLDGRWEWALGLRYFHDEVSGRNNLLGTDFPVASSEATTPRAVLTWFPRENFTVYGSYGQGFRGGLLQNTTARNAGFPDVDSDKLHNYEIGAKADVRDGRLAFDVALYYIDWQDAQMSLRIPLIGGLTQTTALVNGESASGPGVDFAAKVRPLDGLEMGVGMGWNGVEWDADSFTGINRDLAFVEGERLNFSSEWTGTAFTDLIFPMGSGGFQGRFSASANYSSSQIYRDPNAFQSIRGDELWFARAGLSIVAPSDWTATLFVDNLTNEYGAPPTQAPASPEAYPRVRPRTVGIQFEYRYSSAGR